MKTRHVRIDENPHKKQVTVNRRWFNIVDVLVAVEALEDTDPTGGFERVIIPDLRLRDALIAIEAACKHPRGSIFRGPGFKGFQSKLEAARKKFGY